MASLFQGVDRKQGKKLEATAVKLVGGGGSVSEASNRLGLPVDLISEAESFQHGDGVYPDNVQTVMVFSDLLTQWRVGAGGATGIDYVAIPVVFKVRGIKKADWPDIFDGIKIMELAALKSMKSRRK